MPKRYNLLLILYSIFILNPLDGQRFGGGLTLAGTLSQIDGDDIYGFNKLGFQAGIYGKARFSKNIDLEIHFMYNQRGSRSTAEDPSQIKFTLNYIDVPVLLVIKDWLNTEKSSEYYRMHFFGGISTGYLMSSDSYSHLDEDFRKNDFSWILGASYFYHPRWAITGRYTRSFTSLYTRNVGGRPIEMISYFISLGLNYKFQ